jgi:hypothetical protein
MNPEAQGGRWASTSFTPVPVPIRGSERYWAM